MRKRKKNGKDSKSRPKDETIYGTEIYKSLNFLEHYYNTENYTQIRPKSKSTSMLNKFKGEKKT